jgi:hypothetical protein
MPNIAEADDFSPKKIADDLIERMKKAKEWFVYCYIDEGWSPNGKPFPFEMRIVDGIVGCRVICSTYTQAQKMVADFLPVIRFINEPEEDNDE